MSATTQHRLYRLNATTPPVLTNKEGPSWSMYALRSIDQAFDQAILDADPGFAIDRYATDDHGPIPEDMRNVLSFPKVASRLKYPGGLSSFPVNCFEMSLRSRYAPQASLVSVTHAMCYEYHHFDFGTNLLSRAYAPYDAFITTSRVAKEALLRTVAWWNQRFEEMGIGSRPWLPRVEIIPLGVDRQKPTLSRAEARSKLGWTDDEVVLLCLGRISSIDKADLRAALVPIARVIRRQPSRRIRVILAGQDPRDERGMILEFAQALGIGDHVEVLANSVNDEKRDRLYAASDVFFSFSDNVQETFGLTIPEAMAHGLPVVATDWDGYRDNVVHGETGFLVDTVCNFECPDLDILSASRSIPTQTKVRGALARRVAFDVERAEHWFGQLVENRELRVRMGEAGRARVHAELTYEVVGPRYARLIREMMAMPRESWKPPVHPPRGHDHHAIFSHFATRAAGASSRVQLDSRSDEKLLDVILPKGSAEFVRQIMAAVGSGGSTLGQICGSLEAQGYSRQDVYDHVLFAAKYGVFKLESA